MNKLAFTIVAAAALALPLCAQEATVRANIPFEFSVRNTTVPAGKYVITFQTGSLVQLVGSDCYYFLADPAGFNTGSQEPELVFHRYGNQYFLSRISTATSTSRDVPMSRVERELKKTVASARQIPTEIVLAMR